MIRTILPRGPIWSRRHPKRSTSHVVNRFAEEPARLPRDSKGGLAREPDFGEPRDSELKCQGSRGRSASGVRL